MTLEEWKERFSRWQKKERQKWCLLKRGELRTAAQNTIDCRCPITAEFDMPASKVGACAYKVLKLDRNAVDAIIVAADKRDSIDYDPKLRVWLLETCGVKEKDAA